MKAQRIACLAFLTATPMHYQDEIRLPRIPSRREGPPLRRRLSHAQEPRYTATRPVCFGRFLIDVPLTAQVIWGPTSVNDSITAHPDQGHKIRGEIRDKTAEIMAIEHRKEPSALIGVFDAPNTESKIIVGYNRRPRRARKRRPGAGRRASGCRWRGSGQRCSHCSPWVD